MNTVEIDNILGTSEVAQVLGVSKQRIHSLRKSPNFPQPIKMLASTPVWDKKEIVAFLKAWRPWKVEENESAHIPLS